MSPTDPRINPERLAGARTYAQQRANATGEAMRLYFAYRCVHVGFASAVYDGEQIELVQPAV